MGPPSYYQPRPVPAWGVPLPPPARAQMVPPARGWLPPPGPVFPGYPVAQPRPGYRVPPARPVYPPPVAYGGPPRRSRGGMIIAIAAFVLVLALMLGAAVVWARHVGSGRRQPVRASTTWQYPSATPWTSPTTTRPQPPAGPQPVYALGDNPLFRDRDAGFRNTPCSTSTWPFDIPHAEAFYGDLRGCLDPEWKRLLDWSHLPWSSPGLVVAGSYVDSPCGDEDFVGGETAAFYCSSNNTIYMSTVSMSPNRYGNHDGFYLAVYAHEYGHHVQELSGISSEEWNQRVAAGVDSPVGLELSRRSELQAQCFSGMFVGSRRGGTITQHELDLAWNDQDRGDGQRSKRDHGSNEHSEAWWRHGSETNRLWECNTWLSPSDQVS
ncbi:metalloprotease [Mycobacteroides immunogenum]|uniref:Metalloprotease n=2 Tax=Mycobacteroides immunogenum TaxID=83262 RepID=A0A7V8LT79_9MYCO|nr:neutral zinc metallopeptidase [Mycobacteroides immunogenum]AMT71384.1 metalloprotease [Mycobacteroides immunogenum]ANO04495.1 metalloprotease [Mycobacteroides immunogenum]KIU42425.1 metalloprotease [Mycobacteroides immunogenum]KPG14989.1 metalloprotease [Mycobacteroides immunogenum]KPG15605.1 metalloprotease [Mycobacteroides immunogenum]